MGGVEATNVNEVEGEWEIVDGVERNEIHQQSSTNFVLIKKSYFNN